MEGNGYDDTEKILTGGLVLVVAAAVACNTAADYLTEHKIAAEITGFFTVDENYGVARFGDEV